MKTERTVTVGNDYKCPTKCVSWSAIFAGALVGVGLSFLLNLFSLAIGVTAFATATDGTSALAVGGLIALLVSTIVAMFAAGMTAGGLSRSCYAPGTRSCHMGSFYGFATWTVTLIMTVLLAMHMGHFINYTTSKMANPNATVHFTDNQSAPAVTTTGTSDAQQMTVNEDKMAHGFASAAFITFFLFLIGAIACVLGAHSGLCCCRRENGTCEVR
jgi:uncharacterized membrane protein